MKLYTATRNTCTYKWL